MRPCASRKNGFSDGDPMIGIDTNVLLRMLLDDDPDHAPRAVRFIKHDAPTRRR